MLEALPSCQCSPQGQSLGFPPSAELQLRQELSRSSRAPHSDPGIKCVTLTVQIHLLERSSRLWGSSMGWYSCTWLGSRQRSPQGSPQGRGYPCPSVQGERKAQTLLPRAVPAPKEYRTIPCGKQMLPSRLLSSRGPCLSPPQMSGPR